MIVLKTLRCFRNSFFLSQFSHAHWHRNSSRLFPLLFLNKLTVYAVIWTVGIVFTEGYTCNNFGILASLLHHWRANFVTFLDNFFFKKEYFHCQSFFLCVSLLSQWEKKIKFLGVWKLRAAIFQIDPLLTSAQYIRL